MSPLVRAEQPADYAAIHTVLTAAFATEAEARLVEALRRAEQLPCALVAEVAGEVVGQVAFSPITIEAAPCNGVGLAPVAVLPAWQRQGLGTQLIQAGLAVCTTLGYELVVVLGDPRYYQRFGFRAAHLWGLGNEYGVTDEFMALTLNGGTPPRQPGLVRYAPAFAALSV